MTVRLGPLVAAAVAVGAATACVRWWRALPSPPPLAGTIAVGLPPGPSAATDSMADAARLVVSNDPFRLANAPTVVRYAIVHRGDAPLASPALSAATPSVRPTLTLKAIVGGPPWQAVIDGLPGVPPGTVVRAGGVFGAIRVRSVTRDSVALIGPDTAWTLTFRAIP